MNSAIENEALDNQASKADYSVAFNQDLLGVLEQIFSGSAFWLTLSALLIIFALSVLMIYLNSRLRQAMQKMKEHEEFLAISAMAFETQEAILITDEKEKIIQVNKAFTEITGYSSEEVIGKTPKILSSGVQDKEFYRQMWHDIEAKGWWRGEIYNRRKNGEIYPEYEVITKIQNKQGKVTNYLATFSDITQRKHNEQRIHQLAFYDSLTGLANRRLLEELVQNSISKSLISNKFNALLFLDLDHFKNLNDTLGHKKGNDILKIISTRIRGCIRDQDTAARPGGDEFIVLLEGLSTDETEAASQASRIATGLLKQINMPLIIGEENYVISASIGISLFNDQQHSIEDLLKHSDMAMYQAKESGRNAFKFFDPKMQEAALSRTKLESDIRKALEQGQFSLYYQPKVTFNGEVTGYEALIRWIHPERGMVSPAEFIPLAEETGLILPIGRWVIEEACKTLESWQQSEETRNLNLSVNISARQFQQSDLVSNILEITNKYQIDLTKFEIEITESMLMDDLQNTVIKMKQLNEAGINFSLDDFGTGYSSLSYLKSLPVDFLKIDQSFVRDMLLDADDAAIVETIIALAKTLKLEVIAEGVETPEQANTLNQLGCDLLQGYLYGRPEPLKNLMELDEK